MLKIKKEYVVTDDNKKKAVLVDMETFEKIEEILESFGLGKYMEEIEDEEILSVHNAKKYYSTLKKYWYDNLLLQKDILKWFSRNTFTL